MRRPPRPAAQDPDRNLYRRGDTWWCRYVVNGSEQRRSLHTNDVITARKERDTLLTDAGNIRAGREPERVWLWNDAVSGFFGFQEARVKAGSLSAATAARYECSIGRLSDMLHNEPLDAITTGTVMDFVQARREEDRSASTIKNDLTAWSRVMSYAAVKTWIAVNPIRGFERSAYIGTDADALDPPNDAEVANLLIEIEGWSRDMATLVRWLRETGMRLGEALLIQATDIHPDRQHATLRHGVKRNDRSGVKTRTIDLGRGAELLPNLAKRGRLFEGLSKDSAAVSSHYGQWRRQRQGRENRAAAAGARPPEPLREFRLHDLRHAFAIASLIDDPTAIYRLKMHLGHSKVTTTEDYLRFLGGEGAQRKYQRQPDLFGSLPPDEEVDGRHKIRHSVQENRDEN